MPGLLEAAAAVGISGAVLVLMTTSLVSAARIHAACVGLGNDLFAARQLEHLLDRATLRAGAGPAHPEAVSSLAVDTVVFASDQDGNGVADSTSSETTALEVRAVGSQARVRVRLGHQTMTVLEADRSTATVAALDRRGDAANANTATLVELVIAARDHPDDAHSRRMLFSLPARTIP